MRTHLAVATLSLAAALTACNRQDTPTAAQATPASPAASDLAAAPQPYQRMRFVSALEQSRSSVTLQSPEHARHAATSASRHRVAPSAARAALASLVTSAPITMAVASAAAPATSMAIATTHAAPPMSMPAEVAAEFVADRGHGMSGPSVMIRGGVGPNGKCDPRSDAQAAGMLAGRPNSAMPMMPSTSVFGRR